MERTAEEQAASYVAGRLGRALQLKGRAVMASAGGRSVKAVLRHLAAADLPWGSIHLFLTDERLGDLRGLERNVDVVRENLVGPLREAGRWTEGRLHPYRGVTAGDRNSLEEYGRDLAAHGGGCDVVLLGVGEDGHVASLFPRHATLGSEEEFFLAIADSPKAPPERMSMSPRLLARAGGAALLFLGRAKKAALESFLDEAVSPGECPAKIVKEAGDYAVFADGQARGG